MNLLKFATRVACPLNTFGGDGNPQMFPREECVPPPNKRPIAPPIVGELLIIQPPCAGDLILPPTLTIIVIGYWEIVSY
uniref:Uncharacterized protein n=1 Tax=Onchocerca volvulus TaxID=6282 RepID=A0A8R1TY60_ONCVO